MNDTPSKGNGKLLGVLGALALGAAAVMAIKSRRDSDEEEENPKIVDGEGERFLKRISEDDLEALIVEARQKVFAVKTRANGRKSDRFVRKIPDDGIEDCEGTPVTEEVIGERPATPEETKAFEECEEEVAAEQALVEK